MKPPEPRSPEEWQLVVDLAAGCRMIADCRMFGLLEGGPEVDVARCDEILQRARDRGVSPSRPAEEIALDLVRAMNAEKGA